MQTISEKVYETLKSFGLDVQMFDISNKPTSEHDIAAKFISKSPSLMVSIIPEDKVVDVAIDDEVSGSIVPKLVTLLRTATRDYLYTVNITNHSGNTNKPKVAEVAVLESKFSNIYGKKKTSYQCLEDAKIIIKHNKDVEGSINRNRAIKHICLKAGKSEFNMPTKSVAAARAILCNLKNGGAFDDEVTVKIINLSQRIHLLRKFFKYAKLFNSADHHQVVDLAKEQYSEYKELLSCLGNPNKFVMFVDKLEAAPVVDASHLVDLFTVKSYDSAFDEIMPVLAQKKSNLDAKQQYLADIFGNEIELVKKPAFLQDIQYASQESEFASKLLAVAQCVGSTEIASTITEIATKLLRNEALSSFDKHLLKLFFANAKQL